MKKTNASAEEKIDDTLQTVSYIGNEQGKQELVSTTIWDPVNIVNYQAWQEIEKDIEHSIQRINAGRVSVLHYYMTANQMNPGLLAQYADLPRWRVRLHLLPFFFKRLRATTLEKYAELFNVTPEDLIAGNLKPPIYKHQENETQSGTGL